jgi:hypothetical protein
MLNIVREKDRVLMKLHTNRSGIVPLGSDEELVRLRQRQKALEKRHHSSEHTRPPLHDSAFPPHTDTVLGSLFSVSVKR